MYEFSATIHIIGVNPYVFVPEDILESLFRVAGKSKGPIPICGNINGKAYTQTLLIFQGKWRLYINTSMLKNSPKHIGEIVEISVAFDDRDRSIAVHPKLLRALDENPQANEIFHQLSPSGKHEIVRYIASLKSEESRDKNIVKAIDFLLGNGRFVGRDKPNPGKKR